MTKIIPHTYQSEACDNIIAKLAKLQKHKAMLLVSPIASGKTFIAASVANKWLGNDPDDHVLIIVNRVTLLLQTYETLSLFDDNFAIIHGELQKDIDGKKINNIAKLDNKLITGVKSHNKKIIITTVETFKNIVSYIPDYKPGLLIFDEAHKATSEGYQTVRDYYPDAQILGLTATPYRATIDAGECLYEDWYGSNVVETITIKELIELGQLVQPEYIKVAADAHVVETWLAETRDRGPNKRTLVFCRDTAHAMSVLKAFKQSGIASAVITTSSEVTDATKMTILQRNRTYKDFRDGKIDVLISIMALCEGFNEPLARYCFLLRNIGGEDATNPALFTQSVGRVMRPHKESGKSDAIVVDFCDNVSRYGPIEDWNWDIRYQGVRQSRTIYPNGRVLAKTYRDTLRVLTVCEKCSHIYNLKEHTHCGKCDTKNSVTICVTKAELHRVDYWYSIRAKADKPARGNGLCREFNSWRFSNNQDKVDPTTFGMCMTELTKLGICKKRASFKGMKGPWYESA